MLETSMAVVRFSEILVTRPQLVLESRIDHVLHITVGPLVYVMLGMESKFKLLLVWAMSSFALMAITIVAVPDATDQSLKTALLFLAQALPVLLIVFALPSVFATRGVSQELVSKLATYIREVAPTTARLASLRDGIDVFRARASERSASLRWALGISWAGSTWFASRTIFGDAIDFEARGQELGALAFFLLGLCIAFLLVQGYSSTNRIVYQTIDFALAEVSGD